MAQPPSYNRKKNFADDFGNETDHSAMNAELDRASNSINDIRFNLAILQADDGKLRPSVVTSDSLSDELKEYVIEEATKGAAGYAEIAFSSSSEAQASCDSAKASQAAALLSQNAARSSETAAATSQGKAADSQKAAATSETNTAASREAAASSAMLSASSATRAEASYQSAVALYGDLDAVNAAAVSAQASAEAASISADHAAEAATSALASKAAAATSESSAAGSARAASASAASTAADKQVVKDAVTLANASATNAAKSAVDAAKSAEQSAAGQVNADWNSSRGKGQILNKPTTLEGYGITDAAPAVHAHEMDDVTGLKAAFDAILEQVNADWNSTTGKSEILNKPTTLEGYGITDALHISEIDESADPLNICVRPNAIYRFETVSGLTITEVLNGFRESQIRFSTSDIVPVVTIPETLKHVGEWEIEPNNDYIISILDNIAVLGKVVA